MVGGAVLGSGATLGLRGARGVFVAVLAACSLCLSLSTVATYLASDAPDYAAIHAGAGVAAAGGDPYDPHAVSVAEMRDEGSAAAGVLPYFYPPTMTALQLPLAGLPYSAALHVWGALIVGAAVATVVVLVRISWRRSLEPSAWLGLLALGLAFAPLRRGLELGQIDPMLALPATAGILLALRGRGGRGGMALSAVLLKPQLAAVPLVAVVASRRARMLVGLCTGLLVQVATVVMMSRAGYRLDLLAWLRSLRGGDPHRPLVVAAEVIALGVATAVIARRRPWRATRDADARLLLLMSLGAIATAIVGPWAKLNPQSDVLLIVPAALIAAAVMHRPEEWTSLPASLLLGTVTGGLLGDTLFAVTHYDGVTDAIVAVVTVSLALTALALAVPGLAAACLVAIAVDVALTLPPYPPGYDGVVSALAAAGLAVLVCSRLPVEASAEATSQAADSRGLMRH